MIVNVTGHRKVIPPNLVGSPWPDQNYQVFEHQEKIRQILRLFVRHNFTQNNCVDFISGMALGADTLFAEAVLQVRDEPLEPLPVRLIAAVPFKGQESRWTHTSKTHYFELLGKSDEVVYVCEPGYAPWKMQRRNEYMVNRASHTLAIWNGMRKGGTWNCLQYAIKQGNSWWHLHSETRLYMQHLNDV